MASGPASELWPLVQEGGTAQGGCHQVQERGLSGLLRRETSPEGDTGWFQKQGTLWVLWPVTASLSSPCIWGKGKVTLVTPGSLGPWVLGPWPWVKQVAWWGY